MEVRPANLAQITKGRKGQMVQVDDDVQGIANALAKIDHRIRLRYSELGEYWVIYYLPDHPDFEEGDGDLIFTATELDHRIVKHMEQVYWKCQQPGYSFADEVEAAEEKKKKDADDEFTESMGEMYERLGHALRQDTLRNKFRITVPDAPS